MKIAVKVRLKASILDPQGKAVRHALEQLGFDTVENVRVGKLIEVEVADGVSADSARQTVESAARKLLANPVIEEYEIEMGGGAQ